MSEAGMSAIDKAAGSGTQDAAIKAASAVKKALPEQNPALRMMGLPRIRLPSRNWMIFLGVTGSIAGAITYDKWRVRKTKEKWCKLVSHIKDEPLDIKSLPRTLTVYLSAPPGDGLRSAREHFHDYVKPILVAAAIDWDVVEGRKEGDVRYKTAERIRRQRRLGGEGPPVEAEEYTVEQIRRNSGVTAFTGAAGDIVIGRHTWKEYVRGIHEGWLGPVDAPEHVNIAMGKVKEPAATTSPDSTTSPEPNNSIPTENVEPLEATLETPAEATAIADAAATTTSEATQEDKRKEEESAAEEKPKPRQPPPYITPEAYSTVVASRLLPNVLEPSAPVSCPHILGFRNTPIRLQFDVIATTNDDSPSSTGSLQPEQSEVLSREERDWWKTVRQPRKEFEESLLIEPMAFDDRIASRMRKFELASQDEQRVKAIEQTA